MADFPLESLAPLADALRSGRLTLEAMIDGFEARFEKTEPLVQAFLPEDGRFDRLRREARQLQESYPAPEQRPALFGVPIGVKDIFHIDGYLTSAGSRLPPEALRGTQAHSATELLEAGALILGKTVTTEFAYFAPGPTRNPHDPDHTPGGSSSGSAAAVAAGLAPLALGTQTIGSVIRPAAFCGVVGFKPSYDRIPRDGVIPLSPSVDHVGTFTSDAGGAALAGRVLLSAWVERAPDRAPILGVPEGAYLEHASAEGLVHFRAVCKRLERNGYEVRAVEAMDDFETVQAHHNTIVAAEAARVHQAWFAEHEALYHAWTAELVRRGQGISTEALADALRSRGALRAKLEALMRHNRLDLWIAPSAPGPAPSGLESTGDPVMNLPWTHCGFPAINLPSGRSEGGLPYGLQVVAGWYQDERLLAWARQLEAVLATQEERRTPAGGQM